MSKSKLVLAEELKEKLRKMENEIDLAFPESKMSMVFGGAGCGGNCRYSCSYYCRKECEGECGTRSARPLNPKPV